MLTFDDFITIKTAGNSKNLTYSVYDILGEELKSGNLQSQSNISLKKLNSGIYFIRIFDGESFVTKKLICR